MNKHNHHHLAALAALLLCLITPLLASAATSTAVSPLFTVDTRSVVAWKVMAWADRNGNALYEAGEELAGAEVFYAGRTADFRMGLTASDGTLQINQAAKEGTPIFIRKAIHLEPAVKAGHELVENTMYTLWLDTDVGVPDEVKSDGTWNPYKLTPADDAAANAGMMDPVKIQLKHPIFEWNLVIATEVGSTSFSTNLHAGLEEASTYLFDVADGQMKLGKVVINLNVTQGSTSWQNADIVIYNQAEYWPNAAVNGIQSSGAFFGRFPKQMYFGTTWGGHSPERLLYFTSIAHELGHYAFGFRDEYKDGNGSKEKWAAYRKANPQKVPKNYGLMDDSYESSEMSSVNDYLAEYNWPVWDYEVNLQLNEHASLFWGSWYPCWQWLKQSFAKTYAGIPVSIIVPPYGVYLNGSSSSEDRSGPSQIPLPYSKCEVTTVGQSSQALAGATKGAAAMAPIGAAVLIRVSANGRPAQGAQVLRRPASGADVNPLGRTDMSGQLAAYDVAVGDTLVARQRGWELSRLVSEADFPGPIELSSPKAAGNVAGMLDAPQMSSPLGIIVSGNVVVGTPSILSLRIQSSMALVVPPVVVLHVNDGPGLSVNLSAVGPQEYSGNAAIEIGRVGTVEVSCQATNGETLVTTDQLWLGQADSAAKTTLWSRDGSAGAHLAVGAVPSDCVAIVYSGFGPTIYPPGFTKVVVGPVLSAYQGTASALNGTTGVVNVAYRDVDIAGVDETTIRLYRWNDVAWQWELLPSGVSVDANVVSASLTNLGVMALFADSTADVMLPGAINDLSVSTGTNVWSVAAHWTATGDDGNTGTATAYVLKFSTTSITASNWSKCSTLGIHLSPQAAGTAELVQVPMPDPGITYFFAIRAVDEAGNMGPLSNVVMARSHQFDNDGDGMPDQWEATYGLNRTNSADANLDSDGDGLTNREEFDLGTNPTAWDSDGDGMSDGWEQEYGLNPRSATDAQLDGDNDGLNNLLEYTGGRNPIAYDTLRMGDPRVQTDGSVIMGATGEAGRTYILEVSTNLVDWSTKASVTFTNTSHVIVAAPATNAPSQFYRLRQ